MAALVLNTGDLGRETPAPPASASESVSENMEVLLLLPLILLVTFLLLLDLKEGKSQKENRSTQTLFPFTTNNGCHYFTFR